MEAIPTIYKNRQYRSRLEARWAMFFDLLGWKYEYEPYDLKGWIPDFAIFGLDEVLVEVKPYSSFEEFGPEIKKIMAATRETEKDKKNILLLGCTIFKNINLVNFGWIGTYLNIKGLKKEYEFGEATITCKKEKYGFINSRSNAKDKILDFDIKLTNHQKILPLWNKAGNKVQWKPVST